MRVSHATMTNTVRLLTVMGGRAVWGGISGEALGHLLAFESRALLDSQEGKLPLQRSLLSLEPGEQRSSRSSRASAVGVLCKQPPHIVVSHRKTSRLTEIRGACRTHQVVAANANKLEQFSAEGARLCRESPALWATSHLPAPRRSTPISLPLSRSLALSLYLTVIWPLQTEYLAQKRARRMGVQHNEASPALGID